MKNSEIASAIVGGTFFAVPYLALSIPIVPSLLIGACAFAAGELVFRTDVVETLKETNFSLYQTLENAKKQNKHILQMIPLIDNVVVTKNLNEIHDSVNKIIKTIIFVFAPFVSMLIPTIFTFFKSEEKENKYGPVPEGVLK